MLRAFSHSNKCFIGNKENPFKIISQIPGNAQVLIADRNTIWPTSSDSAGFSETSRVSYPSSYLIFPISL